jgi:predicted DNA-binding transcriptional regulator AlpA
MPSTKTRSQPPVGCLWAPEAAAHIGVSVKTLYKWRQRPEAKAAGRPQGFTPGDRYVAYEIAELDAYLARRKADARAENPEMRPPEARIPTQRRAA